MRFRYQAFAKCFHPAGKFVEFPKEQVDIPIPKQFEKIAKQYPKKLAVAMSDSSLTYDELNRQANRIARAILEKCGAEISPIMVLADQSPATLASFLGVLKAEKIMVAVDPLFPLDRLAFMADDSKAAAVLSSSHDLQCAAQLSGDSRRVIDVDAIRREFPQGRT